MNENELPRCVDDKHPGGAPSWNDATQAPAATPVNAIPVDAMIDIETLGTAPGCAILSIGAVMFGPAGLGEEFYAPILLESCTAAGLTIDPRTLAWWMKQGDAARAAAFRDDAEALAIVLYRFTSWFTEHGAKQPWCHGATFDVPLLEAAYKVCGMTPPWKYWAVRDTRTLYDLAGMKVDRCKGVHHNALDDAKVQAEAAVAALRVLRARQEAPEQPEPQRKLIERAIIGLRDGWATRKDADDALALLAPNTSTVSAPGSADARDLAYLIEYIPDEAVRNEAKRKLAQAAPEDVRGLALEEAAAFVEAKGEPGIARAVRALRIISTIRTIRTIRTISTDSEKGGSDE